MLQVFDNQAALFRAMNLNPRACRPIQQCFTNSSASAGGAPVDTNAQAPANSGTLNTISNPSCTEFFLVWSLFTAAYLQGQDRANFVNGVSSLISSNASDVGIFPTVYSLENTGGNIVGRCVGMCFVLSGCSTRRILVALLLAVYSHLLL